MHGQLRRPLAKDIVPEVDPTPQRRNPAGLNGPPQDREGDAVQLDEDDAVDLGIGDSGSCCHLAPQQRGRERVIGAGTCQPGGGGAYSGDDP